VRLIDAAGVIHTLAGADEGEHPKDGGSAADVKFTVQDDLVIEADSAGNVFIGSQWDDRLYAVSCETGHIRTVAGTGSKNYSVKHDGGPATEANVSPQGLASFDNGKVIFINDGGSTSSGNKRIRKLDMESGIITTVAGYGKKGFEGDGGPAISAKFDKPRGMAVDSYGNLYIADADNNRVRVIRKPW